MHQILLQRSPRHPIAGFKGPLSKGREGRRRKEGELGREVGRKRGGNVVPLPTSE